MKFKIDRESLLNPLIHVSGVVERRQTLPILGNVLIVAKDNTIEITATDLEVEIKSVFSATVEHDGSTTLPARKFLDICKALPAEAVISFSLSDSQAKLVSGRSRFTLATLPAEDFPTVDTVVGETHLSLSQENLKRLIERTSFSMAQQDVRYYLNGLLFEFSEDKIRTVATDGHRLSTCIIDSELKTPGKQQVILPKKGVQEILRLLQNSSERVNIEVGSNHLRLVTNDISFSSKLIDGRFPDYDRVIPKGGNKHLIINTEQLKQTLVRTSILSNEKYKGIRLNLEPGTLKVQSNNPDHEQAEEEFEINYQGDPLEIGFNVTYLLDVLSNVQTETIELILSDGSSSCLIQEPETEQFRYVVMPMRL
ncbi:MAG: DNA polymerase III subunit beta [Methylococcaceae bacterium]